MVPFPENGDSGKELVGGIEGLGVNCGFSLKQSLSILVSIRFTWRANKEHRGTDS